MKRNSLLFLLVLQLVAANTYAEFVVKKSTFMEDETGFQNVRISTALNTRTGESLIVWQNTRNDAIKSEILARLVNAKGKPVTPPIIVADKKGSSYVSAAYNPQSDEYAVVYDNSYTGSISSDSDIFARHLNSRGRLKGEEVVISNDSVSQQMSNLVPKIAFHPNTSGYVVVWLRNVEPQLVKQCGLVGALVNQALTRTGAVKMIKKSSEWPKFPVPRSIAFLPNGSKLVVAMTQIMEGVSETTKSDYFLATLDPMKRTPQSTSYSCLTNRGGCSSSTTMESSRIVSSIFRETSWGGNVRLLIRRKTERLSGARS